MIYNLSDYEWTTIDSGILIDGGIMPLRQAATSAGKNSKRCLRGEDIAFIHERGGEFRKASGIKDDETHPYTDFTVDKHIRASQWQQMADVNELVKNVGSFTKKDLEHFDIEQKTVEGSVDHWWEPDEGEGHRPEIIKAVFGRYGLDPFEESDFIDVKNNFSSGGGLQKSNVETVFDNYKKPVYFGNYTRGNIYATEASWFSGMNYEVVGPDNWWYSPDTFLFHQSLTNSSHVYMATTRIVRTTLNSPDIQSEYSEQTLKAIGIFQIYENLWIDGQSLGETFTLTYPLDIVQSTDGWKIKNDVPSMIAMMKSFWYGKGKQFYSFSTTINVQQVAFRFCGVVSVDELRHKTKWWG